MAMKFWAIAFRYDEDVFYNFETGEDEYDFRPSSLLPTKDMAKQVIEDILTDQHVPVEITIKKVDEHGYSYSRGRVAEWDWLPEDEDNG
jgi:hypothetical protein